MNKGIPCIVNAQERSSQMMLNASTVATFFAGVAGKMSASAPNSSNLIAKNSASTLQYTGIDIETTIGRAVQTLWFTSLVLSIGSAVTSLLVLAWRQAVL